MSPVRTHPRLLAGLAAAFMLAAPIGLGTLPVPLGISTARAADISINIFFDRLAPEGVWVSHPQYNYVFCPRVPVDWRPYTRGHWVYLRHYGWYFASDEPFAWAVYHYGRWFADARLGWCWVPGNVFAGAWVSWRRGPDYVGWSPLPPDRQGYAVSTDIPRAEPPRADWVFVPTPRFLAPDLSVSIVVGERQPEIFQRTQYAGPVIIQNNIVVNTIIDLASVEKATGTKITELTPKTVNDPAQQTKPQGDQIALFAPVIAPPGTEKPKQVVGVEEANKALGRPPAGNPPAGNASSSAPPPSSTPASEASSSAPASEKGASSSAPPPSAAQSSSEAPSSRAAAFSSEAPPPKGASSQQPVACPAGEEVIKGKCAPIPATKPKPGAAPSSAPAANAPSSEPPTTAPARKPTLTCPAGEEVIKGKCEPIPAPKAKPGAAPTSAPAAGAPSSEPPKNAPARKPALTCPAGEEVIKGKCEPIPANGSQSAAPAAGDQPAPAANAPRQKKPPVTPCPQDYDLVKGQCVPIPSSAPAQ